MHKDSWKAGEVAAFEYHCQRSHDSADACLWYRDHLPAVVLGVADCEAQGRPELDTLAARMDAACPMVYRVRFPDGLEWDVFEDELLTGAEHFDSSLVAPPPECVPDSVDFSNPESPPKVDGESRVEKLTGSPKNLHPVNTSLGIGR